MKNLTESLQSFFFLSGKFSSFNTIGFYLFIYLESFILNKRSHRFGTVHVGCFDQSDIIAQNRHRFYRSKTIKFPGNASGAVIAYRIRYQQLFSSILQKILRGTINSYNS